MGIDAVALGALSLALSATSAGVSYSEAQKEKGRAKDDKAALEGRAAKERRQRLAGAMSRANQRRSNDRSGVASLTTTPTSTGLSVPGSGS